MVDEKVLDRSIKKIIDNATGNYKALLNLLTQEDPIWLPFADADNPEKMTPQMMAYLSPAQELYFGGAAGGGKALDIDTQIPTINGWKKLLDIDKHDKVFDENGNVCNVILTSDIMYNHRCYEIVFSDQSKIVSDADHQWKVFTYKDRESLIKRTEEYRANRRSKRKSRSTGKRPDLINLNKNRDYKYKEKSTGSILLTREMINNINIEGRANYSIPLASPLKTKEKELLIEPYILGLWLGDGSSYKGEITTTDKEILDQLSKHGYKYNVRSKYSYGIYNLLTKLKSLNLIANKHIPNIYLRSSIYQRIELLQGIMDTDGSVGKKGKCSISLTNKKLILGVKELLLSLGIKANILERDAKLYDKVCGKQYTINFRTDIDVFKLTRKRVRQKKSGFNGIHKNRYIISIDEVPSRPVKCIQVDSPSRLYLAGEDMVPTHNSDLLLGLAITAHQKSRIYRREYDQLETFIERLKELYNPNIDFLREGAPPYFRTRDNRLVRFSAVQHQQFVKKYFGRPADLIGFDEIANFPLSIYQMLTIWNRSPNQNQFCQIVCTGNPPTDEEGEWVIDRWAPWLDPEHPDYPEEPGKIRYFVNLDGIEHEVEDGKYRQNKKGNYIYPRSRTFIPSRIEDNPVYMKTDYYQMLMSLPDELRERMYAGKHLRISGTNPFQVIPTDWVRRAMSRWTEQKPTYIDKDNVEKEILLSQIGVDPARGGNDFTVIAKRYEYYVERLKKYRGEETNDGPKVASLVMKEIENNANINVDVIGIGSSVYDFLKSQNVKVSPINVAESSKRRDKTGKFGFYNLRSESWWMMRELLDPESNNDIALPPDKDLRIQLTAPRYTLTPRGYKVESKEEINKRIGRSTDDADAVILSFMKPLTPGMLI